MAQKRLNISKIVQASALILVALIVYLTGYPHNYYLNNYRLNKFTTAFEGLPLPKQTEVVGLTYKKVGLLKANGNHCEFYAARAISSTLPEEEVVNYYQDQALSPIRQKKLSELVSVGGSNEPVPITVKKYSTLLAEESRDILDNTVLSQTTTQLAASDKKYDEKNIYLLSALDGPYAPNEIRCD